MSEKGIEFSHCNNIAIRQLGWRSAIVLGFCAMSEFSYTIFIWGCWFEV